MFPFDASRLREQDRFWLSGQLWQHCGFYSAVGHVCGFNLQTGERKVVSRHAVVVLFEDLFTGGLGI